MKNLFPKAQGKLPRPVDVCGELELPPVRPASVVFAVHATSYLGRLAKDVLEMRRTRSTALALLARSPP